VFPGCDARVDWTELHHIQHWRDGGRTDLDNLACLCRRHHGIVHSTGWTMTRHTDNTFDLHSPTGKTLRSKPAKRPPPSQCEIARHTFHHHGDESPGIVCGQA
jgi:hypothetical protein